MSTIDTLAAAIPLMASLHRSHGFIFQDAKGVETERTYPEIERLTAERAAALQALGLRKGDRIGLVVIEPEDFVLTFLAAVRVGIIPVPLYPPLSFAALDAYVEKTARVLELSGSRVIVASASLRHVLWGLVGRVPALETLVKAEDLAGGGGRPSYPEISPDDIAFLQYTSGSTSDPKGVIVPHRCLVANALSIVPVGLGMGHQHCAVAWLPLYHDMGLIGFVVATLVSGMKSVFIPTMRFIKKPSVWFDAIHRHRGNVSFAPNFAYALATKKIKDEEAAQWDLSCMTAFGCGAEPIHPETAREFSARFGALSKLPATSFLPAYGMAEATLAISFKAMSDTFRTDRVDLAAFQGEGLVKPAEDDTLMLEYVSCGRPFPGHEIRVVGESGEVLGEGREGELCLRGPSVAPGYWNNPEATAMSFRDGWLHTGDLGYLKDGEVYVTGRLKDLIILHGRNLHPQAIEWAAAKVEGVRKGNVVAFSRPGKDSEELVVVLETASAEHDRIIEGVRHAVRLEVGQPPADVVCIPAGALPKTSSGKLQRRKARSQYLTGTLATEGARTLGAAGNTATVAKHVAVSVLARARTALLGK